MFSVVQSAETLLNAAVVPLVESQSLFRTVAAGMRHSHAQWSLDAMQSNRRVLPHSDDVYDVHVNTFIHVKWY